MKIIQIFTFFYKLCSDLLMLENEASKMFATVTYSVILFHTLSLIHKSNNKKHHLEFSYKASLKKESFILSKGTQISGVKCIKKLGFPWTLMIQLW